MKVPEDSSEQHDSILQTKIEPVSANQERAVSESQRQELTHSGFSWKSCECSEN